MSHSSSSSGSESDVGPLDPLEVVGQLETLQTSLAKLEEQLAPLLNLPLASVTTQLPSVQAAKLQAALAYASSALFFIYLHTAGESTENHPVKKELERVKKYLKKVADATAGAATTANAPTPAAGSKLDKAAAKRFITHQLAGQSAANPKQPQQQQGGGGSKKKAIAIDDSDSSDADMEASDDGSVDEEIVSATAAAAAAPASSGSAGAPATPSKAAVSSGSNAAQAARIAASGASPRTGPSPASGSKRGTETQKRESNKKQKKLKK